MTTDNHPSGKRRRIRWKRWLWTFVAFLLLIVQQRSAIHPDDWFPQQVGAFIAGRYFDFVGWELNAAWLKVAQAVTHTHWQLDDTQRQHREQCSVYQAALDLPVMWTLYYNKSNSNISAASPPFVQEFDAPLWLELEERFRVVHEHRERRTLPARREGYHCRWCAFAWTCKPRCLVRKRGQTHFARIGRDSSPRG